MEAKSQKIMVIGGTGNISRYVVQLFAQKDIDLTVVNRGNRGCFELDGVEYIYSDANSTEKFKTDIEGKVWDIIIDFTVYTIEHIRKRMKTCIPRCRHYVFISSIATYEHIGIEEYDENCQTGNSKWDYGYDKSKVEDEIREYAKQHEDFTYTFIRPGLIYSELWIPDTIHDSICNPGYSIHRILNHQKMIVYSEKDWHYTFMHAEDFAHNLYYLLLMPEAKNNRYNMVGEEKIYPVDVLKYLGNILNKDIDVVEISYEWAVQNNYIGIPVQHQHGNYSNKKIKSVLKEKFHSTNHLECAIEKYVDLFENHQELMWWDSNLKKELDQLIKCAKDSKIFNEWKLKTADLNKPERINTNLYIGMCRKIACAKKFCV